MSVSSRALRYIVGSAACVGVGAALFAGGLLTRPAVRPGLRVLCAEDWLDVAALERFADSRRVRIDLYTYRAPDELLRQLANTDGRIDVVCASSLLVRSLARGRWIKRDAYADLALRHGVSADFMHLPFDRGVNYGVPIHWLIFGYWSAARRGPVGSLKSAAGRGRVGLWAADLNLMALLTTGGVSFAERLESEGVKRLEDDVVRFVAGHDLIKPDLARVDAATGEWTKFVDVAHVPSIVLPEPVQMDLGDDGGIVDVGLLALGARAAEPALARDLLSELSLPASAVTSAARLGRGSVHVAGEGDPRLRRAGYASALRTFELTKLRFPDVNAEATLKFARTFAHARTTRAH